MVGTVEEHYQFTLSQEALNTERHSFERSSRQLRYQTVQFVSGGQKEPDDPAVLRNLDNLVLDRDTTKEDHKEDTQDGDVKVDKAAVVEVEQVEAEKQENKKPGKENQKAGKENQKPWQE